MGGGTLRCSLPTVEYFDNKTLIRTQTDPRYRIQDRLIVKPMYSIIACFQSIQRVEVDDINILISIVFANQCVLILKGKIVLPCSFLFVHTPHLRQKCKVAKSGSGLLGFILRIMRATLSLSRLYRFNHQSDKKLSFKYFLELNIKRESSE